MLRAHLVEELVLDVNVVGPIFALEEGGLPDAQPYGANHKGQHRGQQNEGQAQGLCERRQSQTHATPQVPGCVDPEQVLGQSPWVKRIGQAEYFTCQLSTVKQV